MLTKDQYVKMLAEWAKFYEDMDADAKVRLEKLAPNAKFDRRMEEFNIRTRAAALDILREELRRCEW
jgi:hypothetical protein